MSKARDLSLRHAAPTSPVTKASLGLDNVENTSDATKQTAFLSAATASDVGLGNVDNTSDATKQTAILSAATASDVGLGNVENTALSSWAGTSNITTLGTLTSLVTAELRTTGWHIYGNQWYNHGSNGGSNVYLRTPIVHNESNMFLIEILSYEYGGSYVASYLFSGYAYGGSSLITARTSSIVGRGIGMGVNSQNKVYCVVNSGAGYYNHFTYRYHGWGQKNDADFTWHNSAG